MKKSSFFLIAVISLCSLLTSCSFDLNSPNHKWEKMSFTDENNFLSIRKDLTLKGNYVESVVESGKGDWARSNWSCANLGMSNEATGIDIDITFNENVYTAGIQWWEEGFGSQQFYWISLTKNKCFNMTRKEYDKQTKKSKETGIKYISADKCDVKINGKNNLKAYFDGDGNWSIYVNGQKLYSIPKDDLLYEKGRFFIVYQTIPNQSYSKENAAKVTFKLNSQQIEK